MSVKKVMYAVFFSMQGTAIQIAVPKGKGVTGKFYRDKVLKPLKRYNIKHSPKVELRTLDFFTIMLFTQGWYCDRFCSVKKLLYFPIAPIHRTWPHVTIFCFLDLRKCLLVGNIHVVVQ